MQTMNRFSTFILVAFCSLSITRGESWNNKLQNDVKHGKAHRDARLLDVADDTCAGVGMHIEEVVPSYQCECEMDSSLNMKVANCEDTCNYCTFNLTTCYATDLNVLITDDGNITDVMFTYLYTGNRNDTIVFEKTDCSGSTVPDMVCENCAILVNFEECNSCEIVPGKFGGNKSFNCTNIEPDAVYDLSKNPYIPEDSVFAIWSKLHYTYEECTEYIGNSTTY